jgi:hypothetical protein
MGRGVAMDGPMDRSGRGRVGDDVLSARTTVDVAAFYLPFFFGRYGVIASMTIFLAAMLGLSPRPIFLARTCKASISCFLIPKEILLSLRSSAVVAPRLS